MLFRSLPQGRRGHRCEEPHQGPLHRRAQDHVQDGRLHHHELPWLEANVATPDARDAITIARFNNFINDSLLEGAIDALKRIGQVKDENITVVWVPGAYELPLAAGALAKTGKYDAVIALGTVIRGGTAHFEYVAGGASNGLAHVAQDSEIPVAFGVLTTESIEQAIERAGTKAGNKGAEAALTALEMINVLKAIKA